MRISLDKGEGVPPLRRRVPFVTEQKEPKVSLGATAPKYPRLPPSCCLNRSGAQNLSGLRHFFRGDRPLLPSKSVRQLHFKGAPVLQQLWKMRRYQSGNANAHQGRRACWVEEKTDCIERGGSLKMHNVSLTVRRTQVPCLR